MAELSPEQASIRIQIQRPCLSTKTRSVELETSTNINNLVRSELNIVQKCVRPCVRSCASITSRLMIEAAAEASL